MNDSSIATAHRALSEGIAALRAASDGSTTADNRISGLVMCESLNRQLEQLSVELIAGLDRDGVFAERGYKKTAAAVADLLGWDGGQAARRVRVAEQVCPRVGLDATALPAALPATAEAFAAGTVSLRHVEVIAAALATAAASRLSPAVWGGAEQQLAEHATHYRPRELACFARDLLTALDVDGPGPDQPDEPQPNELHLTRNPAGGGGRIKGSLDAPTFDALATAINALSKPGPGETRTLGRRQAEALREICGYTLDHGELPTTGGERPHLNVTIPLEDLQRRARAALLDWGGSLLPADLRTLACDARVVPIVLGGAGQPLDIGRAMRTVPPHLRRAVAARDRGCAFSGCDRPPSWCEVHHVIPWELGGTTDIDDLVMFCRQHHRLLHHPGWIVRINGGIPELIPPKWIDPTQQPLRKPPPLN